MILNKKYGASCIIILLVSITSFTGCTDTEVIEQTSEKISVLVTIVPQLEMVESIGGDHVSTTLLVPSGQSPHSYEPTPSQLITIAEAEAYFTVGSGVEFEIAYMDTILEQNPNLNVFDCSENIEVLSFDEHYGQEDYHGEDTDDHSGTDPHIWTSPVNYKKMAKVVYDGFVEIDPGHQEQYYANYQEFIEKIEMLHSNITNLLQPYQNKSFMVYHPAWGYFGDTYQLVQLAIEEDGTQPGPAGVAAIIQQAQSENISVIFVSPQFDTSSAETIAEEINGEVVFANPLMQNYTKTLMSLAEEMVKGFQKR
jgi:zinc transport system substrate-binding protein